MIKNKNVLAVIPARGGSKRLPKKNILPLSGKPLITWSIDAAKESIYIDDIFVSTDDRDIANLCTQYNINIPELRPSDLATDHTSTADVLLYTLQKFFPNVDIVVLLQPTSPLRNSHHIDEAIELFIKNDAFSIVSVTPCEHSPLWANTLPENNSIENFITVDALKRSQDLKQYYRLNGAIYIFDVKKLLQYKDILYTNESYAYIMDQSFSVDIDQKIDFDYAEFLIKYVFNKEANAKKN